MMDKHAAKTEAENERLVNFKKSFFGLKAKDVFDYIDLLNSNLGKAHEVYEEKLTEIKNKNDMLSYERNSQEEKLRQTAEEYKALQDERNELKQKVDSQQNREEEFRSACSQIRQMQERIENCKRIEEENRQLKKKIAESEAVCEAREQQQVQLNDEIETLKQQNKETVSKLLDERKQLEERIADKNLKMTKMLEMHRYTLNQSRSTLEKLTAQFDESCKLADQIQAD